MHGRIMDYNVEIVTTTREPAEAGLAEMVPLVEFGASTRATIALAQASRAHAFLRGRAFVTPDDVKAVAVPVLAHRVAAVTRRGTEPSRALVDDLVGAVPTPPV